MYGSVLRGLERSSERKVVTVLLCRPLNLKWFGVRVTPDFVLHFLSFWTTLSLNLDLRSEIISLLSISRCTNGGFLVWKKIYTGYTQKEWCGFKS